MIKPGHLYCGEHAIFDPQNKVPISNLILFNFSLLQDRIPCPNDPKHTVLRQELEEHLKLRCNSRLHDEPWIKESINVDSSFTNSGKKDVSRSNDKLLKTVANIVVEEYKNVKNLVEERFLETELIEDAIKIDENAIGPSKIKHLKQLSSIIGVFFAYNTLVFRLPSTTRFNFT